MDTSGYGAALLRGWWIVVSGLILGILVALIVSAGTPPKYESSVQFLVVAPTTERQSPLQADQLVRERITSYANLVTSEQFVNQITSASGMQLDSEQVRASMSAYGDPDTRVLTATVRHSDPVKAKEIVQQIAANLGKTITDVEGVSTSAPGPALTVIAGPTDPTAPVEPRTTLNLGIGALVGLILGFAVAIGRDRTDKSLRGPDEVSRLTGLPVVGRLPRDRAARRTGDASAPLTGRLAESVRTLRTIIQFADRSDAPSVVAVTSPRMHDGKTTVSWTLARTFAEAGRRTLLVEADLRTSRLSAAMGLTGSLGLADVLGGQVTPADAIRPSGALNLEVLPAGTLPSNPSELLAVGLADLLEDLRLEYDTIILDTPPLLTVTDGALAAALADGTLVLAAADRTTGDQLTGALRELAAVRARLLGVVLNFAARARTRGGGRADRILTRGRSRSTHVPILRRPRASLGMGLGGVSGGAPGGSPNGASAAAADRLSADAAPGTAPGLAEPEAGLSAPQPR